MLTKPLTRDVNESKRKTNDFTVWDFKKVLYTQQNKTRKKNRKEKRKTALIPDFNIVYLVI